MTEVVLAGIATAHSHVFQRLLRGATQEASSRGSFWSWREQMYRVANRIDPDSLYDIARYAYAELAQSGVTAVGEFHYVHHQPDGLPYDNRTAMSEAVIEAAKSVGIRVSLLRVVYQRASHQKNAEAEQRRFCDQQLDHVFEDILSLRKRYKDDPTVCVGIAPHSLRAVGADALTRCAAFAYEEKLPLHMHVSEQPRELDECQAEYGMSPFEMLSERGVLSSNFVAVHATHLSVREIEIMAEAKVMVCVCRSTERDLGDGAPPVAEFIKHRIRMCSGVDGYVQSDPFEEARAIEFDERTRTQTRHILSTTDLVQTLSPHGYEAIGFVGCESEDSVVLDSDDAALGSLDEAIVWSARAASVKRVSVSGGTSTVNWNELRDKYRKLCSLTL